MIDLHTHILPGMDDGAADLQTALQLLQMEKEQGVDAVALTPHFYRMREHTETFFSRRQTAMDTLTEALAGQPHPRLILGAEVAWMPGMADWPELEDLCYENTRTLLVELPFTPWNDDLFRQLYSLEGRRGVTPMIAHVDRYFGMQEKRHLQQLMEMELPMQISAFGLLYFGSQRRLLRLLRQAPCAVISDCHDPVHRPPNLASAMTVVEKKLGHAGAEAVMAAAEDVFAD